MTKHIPKVLVADPISEKGLEELSSDNSLEVVVHTGSSPEELHSLIADCDGLIVRSQTKVNAALLQAAHSLKVVGRAGVGVDNVDVELATQHGIVVMNAPGGNTISTAEHTFSLLLAVARNIPQAHASLKDGKWNRKKFEGVELYNKNLAILGLGRIGTEVARRALAFGMNVFVYDPYLSASKTSSLQVEVVEKLEDLLGKADFITVHMPLNKETHHIIGKKQLPLLKQGVRIINCARGGLIDEEALAQGMASGQIAAAALDVFEVEPPAADGALLSQEKLVATPHLGASTTEAQELVGIEIAQSMKAALLRGEIRNAVNTLNIDAKTLELISPWMELSDRLGRFLAQIAPKRAEKLHIRYSGRISEQDTTPITRSLLTGYLIFFHGTDVNIVNAPSWVSNLGLDVAETRQAEAGEFTDLIEVSVEGEGIQASVGGTFYGSKSRVVKVNGHFIEGHPYGVILLLKNKDRPGIVGHLGSIFAEGGVNIANMSLSRNEVGGMAMTLLNLDSVPEEELMQKLTEDPDVLSAQVIRFI